MCCTLYQGFLHIVAVGGLLCMPANDYGKGGKLQGATGQLRWLQDNFQTVPPTITTPIQNYFRQANYACHCTPLFTKQRSLCSASLICVLETSEDSFSDICPQGLSYILQHNCFFLEWVMVCQGQKIITQQFTMNLFQDWSLVAAIVYLFMYPFCRYIFIVFSQQT